MVAATVMKTAPSRAEVTETAIKAVAFDGFAIFDPGSIFRLVEQLFPGRGTALSTAWRVRQFEYTWLHNSMHQYKDFWGVTQDALIYASKATEVELHPEQMERLMSAYLEMKPWPDVADAIKDLRGRGLRLAILSNMTAAMMRACVTRPGLESAFEFQLSGSGQGIQAGPAFVQYGPGGLQAAEEWDCLRSIRRMGCGRGEDLRLSNVLGKQAGCAGGRTRCKGKCQPP